MVRLADEDPECRFRACPLVATVEAVRQAQQLGSLVVVAGSLYLVGEIRANLA